MPGTLFVVATPIGNLDDVTARALRVLREVALIAAEDTRRTGRLLARYAIPTPLTSLHQHNEGLKIAPLLDRLGQGESVALVADAGTPTISDPGHRLVQAAIGAGIRVEPIPGPSALMAALAVSGFPADAFTFLGFPPTLLNERLKWLDELRSAGRNVVFFEAPHRIRQTLEAIRAIAGGSCRICVARELTKVHEELVIGPISDVLQRLQAPRGELTIVVDVCHITETCVSEAASDDDVFAEFGQLTASGALRRRAALTVLARRHLRSPNDIYAAIERAKSLSNDQ